MSDYHNDYSRLSRTMLVDFEESPNVFYRRYVERSMPVEDLSKKRHVDFGTLLHKCVLEGKELFTVAKVYPLDCYQKDGRVNAIKGKKYRQQNPDHICLADSEVIRAEDTIFHANTSKLGLLVDDPGAIVEKVFEWEDDDTGLSCRCKPDLLIERDDKVEIHDLKFSESVHPDKWRRTAKRFRYWLQDQHYCAGVSKVFGKPVEFTFWAVETVRPHRVVQYQYDPISREVSHTAYRQLLSQVAARYLSGDWKDPWTEEMNFVELSPWEVDSAEIELGGFDDDEEAEG